MNAFSRFHKNLLIPMFQEGTLAWYISPTLILASVKTKTLRSNTRRT